MLIPTNSHCQERLSLTLVWEGEKGGACFIHISWARLWGRDRRGEEAVWEGEADHSSNPPAASSQGHQS